MQACRGAVDRLHARLLPDAGALHAAPGPAAGTSSSSSSACTASSSAATAQQSGFVCPSSAPPVVSPPSFRKQMPHTEPWHPSADLQPHQGWPSFSANLSGLNTSGLSSFLDQALGQLGGPPVPGTSSQMHTPEGRPVSRTSSTSDILRSVSQAMDQDQEYNFRQCTSWRRTLCFIMTHHYIIMRR